MLGNIADRQFSRRQLLKIAVLGAEAAALPPWVEKARADGVLDADLAGGADTFEGPLVDVGSDWLEVEVDGAPRMLTVSSQCTFWKGGRSTLAEFASGDDVLVQTIGSQLSRAWSNLARVEGVFLRRNGDAYVVRCESCARLDPVDAEVTVSAATLLEDGATGLAVNSMPVLPAGTVLDSIGLAVDGGVHATLLAYLTPSAQGKTSSPSGPDSIETFAAVGPEGGTTCTCSYNGYASWFNCSTGAGKCAKCSTSRNDQCVWPHVDYVNGSYHPCNVGGSCKAQVQAPCGHAVYVSEPCQNRKTTTYVADCGPNQNDLCSRWCACPSGNYNRRAPVVDLTKPTFARFWDPATRGCFPCTAQVVVPC